MKEVLEKIKKRLLEIKDYVLKNREIALICVAAVIVIILLLVIVVKLSGKKQSSAEAEATTVPQTALEENLLEENAYPEVNSLVDVYYKALADGDMDAVENCRNYTEDTEKIRLAKKSEYVEQYENITVYTKKGLLDNTYLAYVYYEVKFKDIDTLAPALNTLYICPNEQGELYIYEGEIDDNVSEYLKELSTQDDVLELFNRVQVSYNEAIEKDEALNTLLTELPTKIKTEVGEALAALETGEAATDAVSDNSVSGNDVNADSEQQAPQPAESTTETVETTDTVNVRSSDSETADKLGKAAAGEQYTRLETRGNGWSKIQYEGQEAYIKSEYLKVVSEEEIQDTAQETEEAPAETQGTVTVKETVNIRKSASETADKLGVAYQGDKFDLIMKQADGWSKINYKGQTGYVKSEYVN